MYKNILKLAALIVFSVIFYSCSDTTVQAPIEQAQELLRVNGTVETASVNGCYSQTVRYITNEINLNDYKKLVVKFKGETNSAGSLIEVYSESGDQPSMLVANFAGGEIWGDHAIVVDNPAEKIWLSMRININPPVKEVCGHKYASVKDLIVYGVR
jgi:hypothetical protein